MIAIELTGGLGNQLFEYAFIFNQHKKLKTGFFLKKSGSPADLYEYFELRKSLLYYIDVFLFNHHNFKLLFSHYLRGAFNNTLNRLFIKKIISVDNIANPDAVKKIFGNNVFYRGYFQSEKYFSEFARELAECLKIKPVYANLYRSKFKWLQNYKTIVVVHVRLADYKNSLGHLELGGEDLSLPLRYYHQLIHKIDNKDNFYVIISDEIDTLKTEFEYLEKKYFSEEAAIIDFQLMMNADICIISNSTFSWWAAYLNKKKKKVYCPRHFLGFLKNIDYPTEIYPETWVQVQVN